MKDAHNLSLRQDQTWVRTIPSYAQHNETYSEDYPIEKTLTIHGFRIIHELGPFQVLGTIT